MYKMFSKLLFAGFFIAIFLDDYLSSALSEILLCDKTLILTSKSIQSTAVCVKKAQVL